MIAQAVRHSWPWILPGMVMLAILVHQLRTGKAVTKRWMKAGLKNYHRETEPGGYWVLVVVTGGSAIVFLGMGVSQLILFFR